jgi:hypothetical protein
MQRRDILRGSLGLVATALVELVPSEIVHLRPAVVE